MEQITTNNQQLVFDRRVFKRMILKGTGRKLYGSRKSSACRASGNTITSFTSNLENLFTDEPLNAGKYKIRNKYLDTSWRIFCQNITKYPLISFKLKKYHSRCGNIISIYILYKDQHNASQSFHSYPSITVNAFKNITGLTDQVDAEQKFKEFYDNLVNYVKTLSCDYKVLHNASSGEKDFVFTIVNRKRGVSVQSDTNDLQSSYISSTSTTIGHQATALDYTLETLNRHTQNLDASQAQLNAEIHDRTSSSTSVTKSNSRKRKSYSSTEDSTEETTIDNSVNTNLNLNDISTSESRNMDSAKRSRTNAQSSEILLCEVFGTFSQSKESF